MSQLSNINPFSKSFDPLWQTFETIDVPTPGLALFTLSLRFPGPAKLPSFTYTFPLSPQALRKEFTAMSTVYDIQGNAKDAGVQRVVDVYGNSPPTFVIEGTTGQKRHATDGYLFTGRQSIDQILYILTLHAQVNQVKMKNNDPHLYTLEFYNYFAQEFWEVVPVGPQGVSQTVQAPGIQFYRLRLAAVKSVRAPLISNLFADQVAQLLIAGSNAVSRGVQALTASALGI